MSTFKKTFELTYPNAAGIDIGASSHFVAVPADRDEQPVREFASFTEDLHAIADWLTACGIDTVAMESTGVYWIPLFELLESRGFTVFLVNSRHVKNVPGRKSDVLDCQWLQQLMSFGLLSGAFRPQGDYAVLRVVARLREMLLRYQATHVQPIQKALLLMNILLTEVLSDVMGETGQKIIRAILAGERDGEMLARYRNGHVKASEEEITKAAQALKMAAVNLRNSQSALGAYYRRLCGRMDKGKAVTACAHKLARLIYAMLTKGEDCVDQGQTYYEEKYRERVIKNLTKRAEALGFQLTPAPEMA